MFLISLSYIRLVGVDTDYSVRVNSCLLVVHSLCVLYSTYMAVSVLKNGFSCLL